MNKYGFESLNFEILKLCKKEDLIKWEQFYMGKYLNTFNICPTAGSSKNSIRSKESVLKVAKAHYKPINQYNKEGEFIATFESIISASKRLGLNQGNISKVRRGIYQTTGGYKFR